MYREHQSELRFYLRIRLGKNNMDSKRVFCWLKNLLTIREPRCCQRILLTLPLLYANEVNHICSCSKLRLTGKFELESKIYMLSRFLGQDMEIKVHRNKDKWLLYCLS